MEVVATESPPLAAVIVSGTLANTQPVYHQSLPSLPPPRSPTLPPTCATASVTGAAMSRFICISFLSKNRSSCSTVSELFPFNIMGISRGLAMIMLPAITIDEKSRGLR
ncbi:hypothetical protein RIF29_21702 [Crotalaria pallida]|uniref:Uncharacterized protein n=1 Tax=Crotalaria pallida TaxID=3830 RepID=A0AAN9I661_CROPI